MRRRGFESLPPRSARHGVAEVARAPAITDSLTVNWGGIGQLALEAVGVHDAAGFVFSSVAIAGLFATLSALGDLSRPRALYRAT
jgi:hypothetical protein